MKTTAESSKGHMRVPGHLLIYEIHIGDLIVRSEDVVDGEFVNYDSLAFCQGSMPSSEGYSELYEEIYMRINGRYYV